MQAGLERDVLWALGPIQQNDAIREVAAIGCQWRDRQRHTVEPNAALRLPDWENSIIPSVVFSAAANSRRNRAANLFRGRIAGIDRKMSQAHPYKIQKLTA